MSLRNPINIEATYQNGYNVDDGDPSIDRCRGGLLKITLKIPSETITVDGARYPTQGRPPAPGTVRTSAMTADIEIDFEELPLVDTAGYKIEEEQTSPGSMPYPPEGISFSFS